jgi:hypothetical protein
MDANMREPMGRPDGRLNVECISAVYNAPGARLDPPIVPDRGLRVLRAKRD